ncbi:hypothetical protein [Spongiibacter marinus]|uniref:hypothetical protein n=1 Tax=Spongiibacter marinus TaxID=354246 RepID=UPI0012B5A9C9|nr:hypothetical protein [Spongiibacter marinus]
MHRIAFILLILVPLVSCSTYEWVYVLDPKPEIPSAQFGTDKADCLSKAYAAVPQPQTSVTSMQQTQNVSVGSSGIPVDQRGASDVQQSLANREAMRAQANAIETAKRARQEYFLACMQSKGWSWQEVAE